MWSKHKKGADKLIEEGVVAINGQMGELVTNNAKAFMNVPRKISYKGHFVIRGEAVIGYKDFEAINRSVPDGESK